MTSILAVLGAADPSLITIGGLPLHPLAVHAAVVLLPLAVMGLVAIIVKPAWRQHYGWLVMGSLVAGIGATVVAVQAGEQLALITGITEEHKKYGKVLEYEALALLVFAVWWFWQQRAQQGSGKRRQGSSALGRGPEAIAALGSLVLGVGSLLLAALVGHSGATAVWANKIAPAPTPTNTASTSTTGYTLADVQKHNSSSDCWTAVGGNAYNVTDWIGKHPGGPGVIQGMCGIDASAAFTGQHSGSQRAKDFLAGYRIGKLTGGSSTTPTKPVSTLTLAGVQSHNTAKDCWSIVSGKVYKLTDWISRHPGGPGVIQGMCGIDATAAFNGQHGGASGPKQTLAGYLLGALKG